MSRLSLSRRRFLQAGALSVATSGVVAARVGGGDSPGGSGEKSCIFILLCGGPSHLDTWDLKPNAPAEIRGPYSPIATTVPGMRISELHPRMAKLTNRFALIRSMTHPGNISNHFDAMHNSLSGQASAPQDSPYIGSVLAKVRPSQKNVASYVWLIKCVGDPVFCAPNIGTGGSLGAPYAPLFVGSADNHPAKPGFKAPDVFAANETPERMNNRRALLDNLEASRISAGTSWRDIHGRGFELATAAGPRQAFEVDREDPRLRDRYGLNPLGQNLLLARRLVESGVGFVTVNGWTGPAAGKVENGPPSSSWDMHGAEMGMGNAFGNGSYGMGWCLPVLDNALSALIEDLEARGLLDNTLIVCMGEFGRTPRINQNNNIPGRQHWPHCYSAILAGGGIRGGMVYGESDKIGAYVKDKPVRPQDFSATVYHALGVPYESKITKDGVSKPLSTGTPLVELFG
ncbi:MAG TPA: DUF1501 domain-containing protein [Gemmataceae bacterium]|jgi:hypothetical protein|nr:DUF1501 domain-containing protein [Gemmataceae bacterium]